MGKFCTKVLFVFRIVQLEGLVEVADESEREGGFFVAILFGFLFFGLVILGGFGFVVGVGDFFDEGDFLLRERAFS